MSDISNINEEEKKNEEQKQTDPDLVKALNDYKSDMFKYKGKAKELEEENQRLKMQKESLERDQLEKNEEWKTLYENERKAKSEAVDELSNKSKQFVDSSKKNAVVQRLGGFKKDEYIRFINTENIELNADGLIDSESLNKEVDRIKQSFPELLKTSEIGSLPTGAPSDVGAPKPKKVSPDMSHEELRDAFAATQN